MRHLAAILCLLSAPAFAQSNPSFITGQIPTAAQWNSYFGAKADVAGGTINNGVLNSVTINGSLGGSPTVGGVWTASNATLSGFGITGGTLGGSITATGATITGGTFSGATTPVTTVTGNYLTVSTDRTVCVNDGASSPTITLGAGFAAGILQIVTDCGLHASAHNITIVPTSGTISGFSNVLFNQNGTSQAFRYTGTAWVMQ